MTDRDAASPAPQDIDAMLAPGGIVPINCLEDDIVLDLLAEVRSLRERLKFAEDFKDFEKCDNPLRPEITCAMLVRDNDNLRAALKSAETKIARVVAWCDCYRGLSYGSTYFDALDAALADAESEGIAP